jgi:hypothetical protein
MDKPAKRPYETPVLVPSSLFGAEAMTGSCCRGASCTSGARNTQRTTLDPSKKVPQTTS